MGYARPALALDRDRARLTLALVATVLSLTAIAPLATDMYVPVFPAGGRARLHGLTGRQANAK